MNATEVQEIADELRKTNEMLEKINTNLEEIIRRHEREKKAMA